MATAKRILKVVGYAAMAILVILILLAGLTQTKYFKDRLRTLVISELSQQLNGSISIARIRGNFLNGFTLDSVALYHGADEPVTLDQLSVSYDPLPLLDNRLVISDLLIDRPRIRFRRTPSGEWNVFELFKAANDTSQERFAWHVEIANFRLLHGTVSLDDSIALRAPDHVTMPADTFFEYHHFTIHDINVQLSAKIAHNSFAADIKHASGYSEQPDLMLADLRGSFAVDSSGLAARNVTIATTRSSLTLDASLQGANVFEHLSLAGLEHDSSRVHLRGEWVDLGELKALLHQVDFLEGKALVVLDASGQFGRLDIQDLTLQTSGSTMQFRGVLTNLHNPDSLRMQLAIGSDRMRMEDVARLMPRFGIPPIRELGTFSLQGDYEGAPLDFRTTMVIRTGAGDLGLRGGMDLRQSQPAYGFTFRSHQLILGRFVPSAAFSASITASGNIRGRGFSLDSVDAMLNMTFDSSRIQDLRIASGKVELQIARRAVKGKVACASGEMSASVAGELDLANRDQPSLSATMDLAAFDLSSLLRDTSHESSLNLSAKIAGVGGSLHDWTGHAEATLRPSMYRHHQLGNEHLVLDLDQSVPAHKQLTLESSFAHMTCEGKFDLDFAVAAIEAQASNLLHAVAVHAVRPDSVLAPPPGPLSPGLPAGQFDFTYALDIKDLEPISAAIGTEQFSAKGAIAGSVKGTTDVLSFSTRGRIDEFYIGTIGKGVFLEDIDVDAELTNLKFNQTLRDAHVRVKAAIGSGVVDNVRINDVDVSLTYGDAIGRLSAHGRVDSLYAVTLAGRTSITPGTYGIDLDTLQVASEGLSWSNDQDVQVRLNYEGLRLMRAVMRQDSASIDLQGYINRGGSIDLTGKLRAYNISGLNFFLHNPELIPARNGLAGELEAGITVSGTTRFPVVRLTLIGSGFSFREASVGSVAGTVEYEQRLARVDLAVRRVATDSLPLFTARGTVPVDLALEDREGVPDTARQEVTIESQGFDLTILDPILRDFDKLRGQFDCSLLVRGTPAHPEYTGTIALRGAEFLFGPNQVSYVVDGELVPSGNLLVVKRLNVKNPPGERHGGNASFTGSIALKDFRIASFDLRASGSLLLMTDETRRTIPTVYGTLLAEIDTGGLSITGTLERPYIEGKLYVLDANLIFPPTLATGRNAGQSLTYVVVDDTSKSSKRAPVFFRRFFAESDTSTAVVRPKAGEEEPSLIDRLRYNLIVETRGTTAVKMVFTPATNEELYAELEGRVSVINDRGTPKIYGSITVSPRSYYNFFKRFDARGELEFVGPWDNPELKINATYVGYRATPAALDGTASAAGTGEQKVIVELKITGTRYEPKLDMGMKVQLYPDREPVDWATQTRGGDVQSDAISFILTGKFRDELSPRERENIAANFGSAGVTGFTSNLLSGILTEYLRREFPFIRSAEFTYQGGNLQEHADIRLSGEAFRGYFRFGGRIFNDLGDANVSYQLSLGDVFGNASIRNLFIELERKVEGNDFTADKRLTNGARLYYRISF
jgi:autotransporter translocation and assembly factor TamB